MRWMPGVSLAWLLAAGAAQAMPTHYWEFEGPADFLSDSIGSAGLTASGSPTQVAIPGSGRGSEFSVLPGNASAADLDIGDAFSTALTLTSHFTIEVLVHLDADPGIFGYTFAGFATGDAPSEVGWVFQTRQSSATGPDNLVLATGYLNSVTFFNSLIPLEAGKDYYLAAAFDTLPSGATATFWVANLTDGPVQSATVHIGGGTFVGLNDIGTFVIGDSVHNTAGLDGLIDQVRLSDSVLAQSQLLVPVPEPTSLGLLALGVLLTSLRARRAQAPRSARTRRSSGRPR